MVPLLALCFQPKYVHQLLKNAAARKLDDERRLERQAHREREKEGDSFGDKEAYITPRYGHEAKSS